MIDTQGDSAATPAPQTGFIRFVCPRCGQMTGFSAAEAGKNAPCERCGESVAVPTEGDVRGLNAGGGGRSWNPLSVGVLIGVTGAMIVVVIGLLRAAHESSSRQQCLDHFGRVAMGMLAYHDRHGVFPAPSAGDRSGRPTQSWRVAILPYIGEETLYNQFDLSSPWDAEKNVRTRMTMPEPFGCPLESDLIQRKRTRQQVVVGQATIFPPTGPLSLTMIDSRDGSANTILCVESRRSVAWNEPSDLDARRMSYRINDPDKEHCIGSQHPGGASAAFADGHTRSLRDTLPPEVVRALIGVDDKVQIDWSNFP